MSTAQDLKNTVVGGPGPAVVVPIGIQKSDNLMGVPQVPPSMPRRKPLLRLITVCCRRGQSPNGENETGSGLDRNPPRGFNG